MLSFSKVGSFTKFSDGITGSDFYVLRSEVGVQYHSGNTMDIIIHAKSGTLNYSGIPLANILIAGVQATNQANFEAKFDAVFPSAGWPAITTTDFELTDSSKGIILHSPSSIRYRLTIGDDGALISTAI